MTGTGDIVIDCGYTKCFTKMATDGTFRYVQNIAGWTARPEVHQRIDGIQPCDWRPKAVEYTIIKGVKWNHFDPFPEQFVPIDPHTLRNLWAIDCSGSVKDAKLYHEELKKIIDEYYKNGDDIWLWSNESKHVNYEELQIFNNRKLGKGGTESSLIAQIAQSSDCRDHLIIVTDGDVNTGAIDRSDEIMKNSDIKFKYVTTFIIGTGSLSVGAPYSRGCQNVTYSVKSPDDRTIAVTLSNEDIAALNNIANINAYDQFIMNYEKLDSAIQAVQLGKTGDLALQQILESLKQRVINNGLNSQQKLNFDLKFDSLMRMANGALRNRFTLKDIAAAKKGK